MRVGLQANISDPHIDFQQNINHRQLSVSISAILTEQDRSLPLNLCLAIDRSSSMHGDSLEKVKQAAVKIVEKLKPADRLSIVAFNHQAQVIVPSQSMQNMDAIIDRIEELAAEGGTNIDEALKLGIREIAAGKQNTVSQIFLFTDGENEHGDNERCIKLAELSSEYNITVNTLGFGSRWNQNILEKIADSAHGTLIYIEKPEQVAQEFEKLFTRIQTVGLTNAHLLMEFMPKVRLAELRPIAQVAPETIEMSVQQEGNFFAIRLGDLMVDRPRIILVNCYVGNLPLGNHTIATIQIRYDDPANASEGNLSQKIPIEVEIQEKYQPSPDETVKRSVLTLAKYRQAQIAESKLEQGDRKSAITMLQAAAQTALQLGDNEGATVLQASATCLQSGNDLSEVDRKKTRIASKTILEG